MESKRILFLLPFLHFGVGRLVVDIMRAAHRSGAEVYLATGSASRESLDDPVLLAELSQFCSGRMSVDVSSRDEAAVARASGSVGRACEEWNITEAHAFTAIAAACAQPHVRTVATVVGWAAEKPASQRRADADILRRCAVVTAVSRLVLNELNEAGLNRPDAKLIIHGIRLPEVTSPGNDRAEPIRTVGVMAHLINRKGVDVVLRALALPSAPSFGQLLIAGTGEEEAPLRQLARDLALSCEVVWAGQMDVDDFFSRVDLAVVPSRSDALPLVLLHAMAAGVPVVASNVDGIPEAVRPGIDGLLVPPDDPAALSCALALCAEAPAQARIRAANARRRIEREFSIDHMLSEYLRCYHSENGVCTRGARQA